MTARFVAEYSIQLSYECRWHFVGPGYHWLKQKLQTLLKAASCMVHSTGFEPVTARFVAEYSIQLSYECICCHAL